MNLSQFNRILRQVFLLPVIALLLTAGALYWQITSRQRDRQPHSGRRMPASRRQPWFASCIVDEESGLRGYETTGDARFLQPFREAEVASARRSFSDLDDMAGSGRREMTLHRRISATSTRPGTMASLYRSSPRSGQAAKTNDVDLNLHGKESDGRRFVRTSTTSSNTPKTTARSASHSGTARSTHMLAALLLLALGMGILIGLFTRSRLHAVSAAYRTSLEMLGRRAEEIFQSEQQLRTTLASIGDGVITCDADGRIQMMNPVARELTGWSQAEASGQPLEEVFHIVNETDPRDGGRPRSPRSSGSIASSVSQTTRC